MRMSAVSARHAPGQSRRALMFFAVAAGAALLSVCLAAALTAIIGRNLGPRILVFPAAFWVSTALLAAGSLAMQRALAAVKLERQSRFRRWLWSGWSIGIAFVGVQSYALWCIMPADRTSQAAQSGATTFILALATLHALHFIVAVMFVSFVVVLAMSDRYDHEYHWGVTFCAGFWHFLGVVWLVVLAIIVIAFRTPTV
jgi:cytochrome c oxidase subunit 3